MGKSVRRHPTRKPFSLFLWHRTIGLLAAVGLVWLATSGLLLLHGDDLGLEKQFVQTDWLLDWYRVPQQIDTPVFASGTHVFSSDGRCFYFDSRCLLEESSPLVGALPLGETIVVASTAAIYLLDGNGNLLERLDETLGMPQALRRIGVDGKGRLVLDSAQGIRAVDLSLPNWKHPITLPVSWVAPTSASPALREELANSRRKHAISWFRVIRDAHAGWLVGRPGRWLMEASAILIIFLALSGIGLWIYRKRKAHRGHPHATVKKV